MNELLQKHGCANVFTIPEGLKELMSDISREVALKCFPPFSEPQCMKSCIAHTIFSAIDVLRDQPENIFRYIQNYLSVLLITREHGILAVRILDDLCDCRPSVSEHLTEIGIDPALVERIASIIKEKIEEFEPVDGQERLREADILKMILKQVTLDEQTTSNVIQVIRNAYRDYWYRKNLLEKNLNLQPEEPWEIAAENTLKLYKKTKPSFSELTRATKKIQAAYRSYYVRRHILGHLKPKKPESKLDLPGPPIDVAGSREIDLGPAIALKVREENTARMFDEVVGKKLGVLYDPNKTLTMKESDTEKKSARFLGSDEIDVKALDEADTTVTIIEEHISTVDTRISFTVKEEENQEDLFEVPEEVLVPDVADYDQDEVPEDISYYEDGEGTAASVPTSARDTTATSDVENDGEDEA